MTKPPSTPPDLMAYCRSHGIRLAITDGDRLEIDSPLGAMTPDVLARLRTHKADLLAFLHSPPPGGLPPWDAESDEKFTFDQYAEAEREAIMAVEGGRDLELAKAADDDGDQEDEEPGEEDWTCITRPDGAMILLANWTE